MVALTTAIDGGGSGEVSSSDGRSVMVSKGKVSPSFKANRLMTAIAKEKMVMVKGTNASGDR